MTPRAIAVVATKGGVGKTTVCANLAARALRDTDKVAVIDADPQQALARWVQLRNQHEGRRAPKVPELITLPDDGSKGIEEMVPAPDFAAEVVRLKAKGSQYIFLDAPPALMHLSEAVVMASDVVIIPVRASPVDLESINPSVELCEAHGRPFAFVLTHYDEKWKLSKTATGFLEEKGKVFPPETFLRYRAAYVGSMLGGLAGFEHTDRDAAKACWEDIDALWKAVKRLAQTVKLARVR